MKFRLEFQCDNAAFDADGFEYEIAAVLANVTKSVHEAGAERGLSGRATSGYCYDSNGNRIGAWSVGEDRPEPGMREELLDALAIALPWVEDHEMSEHYTPGTVKKAARRSGERRASLVQWPLNNRSLS